MDCSDVASKLIAGLKPCPTKKSLLLPRRYVGGIKWGIGRKNKSLLISLYKREKLRENPPNIPL